jgi:integrase/recombinase XerD
MLMDDALKEFLFECEVKKYTWKTIKGYRNGLEFLINYLKNEQKISSIEEINTQHLKAFFMYQSKRKRKETYLNGLLKTYRAFFKYLVNEEYLSVNPVLKVSWMKEPKTVIKTFSDDEVRKMLEAFSESDYMGMRNKAIIAMLFDTGIRNYELCTLPQSNLKDNYIVIFGKGKKERQVGKSPYLSKILLKYERIKKYYFEYKNINVNNYFLSRTPVC